MEMWRVLACWLYFWPICIKSKEIKGFGNSYRTLTPSLIPFLFVHLCRDIYTHHMPPFHPRKTNWSSIFPPAVILGYISNLTPKQKICALKFYIFHSIHPLAPGSVCQKWFPDTGKLSICFLFLTIDSIVLGCLLTFSAALLSLNKIGQSMVQKKCLFWDQGIFHFSC